MKKTLVASSLAAGMIVVGLASPAAADPTDVYPAPLNGSGSDTTEIVMRALDAQIGNLASWDVAGGPWDTNGAGAGCAFTGRILGSSDGRRALANSVTNTDGCFQFARSSSRSTGQATATLSNGYTASAATVSMLPITLAVDGLTYVFRGASSTPRDLTLGQLRGIYRCEFTTTVDNRFLGGSSIPNKPLLPTDASGSRADWLLFMGLSATAEVASDGGGLAPCVDDGPGDSIADGEFAEHNGNVLTSGRQIILHSIPQYIAQGRSADGDSRGLSVLGYINGNVPLQMYDNPGGTLNANTATSSTIVDGALFRPVYNVIPAAQVSDPTVVSVFGTRGGGSDPALSDVPNNNSGAICNADGTVISNGFTPVC